MQLRDASWAVAYGLTIWGFTAGGDLEPHQSGALTDMVKHTLHYLKKFLP